MVNNTTRSIEDKQVLRIEELIEDDRITPLTQDLIAYANALFNETIRPAELGLYTNDEQIINHMFNTCPQKIVVGYRLSGRDQYTNDEGNLQDKDEDMQLKECTVILKRVKLMLKEKFVKGKPNFDVEKEEFINQQYIFAIKELRRWLKDEHTKELTRQLKSLRES